MFGGIVFFWVRAIRLISSKYFQYFFFFSSNKSRYRVEGWKVPWHIWFKTHVLWTLSNLCKAWKPSTQIQSAKIHGTHQPSLRIIYLFIQILSNELMQVVAPQHQTHISLSVRQTTRRNSPYSDNVRRAIILVTLKQRRFLHWTVVPMVAWSIRGFIKWSNSHNYKVKWLYPTWRCPQLVQGSRFISQSGHKSVHMYSS